LTDRFCPTKPPQQNASQFDAKTTPEWETNTAGWHDAEKDSKTPSIAQSTRQTYLSTCKPNFSAWCHSFLFKSIATGHNTARSYFLRNNVEEKITEWRFVAVSTILSPQIYPP